MLYDPKWEIEIKADPFSLEGLIAWLEKQPANTEYDWESCERCLVGEYVKAVTGSNEPSGKTIYAEMFPSRAVYSDVAASRPWTFGAALERARAAYSAAK